MDKKIIRQRLVKEISDIRCEYLYACYHEGRGGHSQEMHCGLSHLDLVLRAREAARERRSGGRRRLSHEADGLPAELSVFSRFYGDREKMCSLIADTLMDSVDELMPFINSGQKKIHAYKTFPSPVGDCVLEEGDWDKLYPISMVCVVVVHSDMDDRLFRVKTAFPNASTEWGEDGLSEVDRLYNELENYFREKGKIRSLDR